MRKSTYLFIFILFLSVSCFSQHSTQFITTKTGEILQLEVKVDKETIMLGETTYISFEIKNFSGNDFYTGLGLRADFTGRPIEYEVTVVGENGKSVSQPREGGAHGFGGIEKIPMNGSYINKLYLPDWATFEDTGIYTITVKKNLGIGDKSMSSYYYFPIEISTKINIISTDKNKLGELIDSLGKKILETDISHSVNEVPLFAFIEDPRVIKYHIQILEKFGSKDAVDLGYEFDLSRLSTWALKKYNDAAALEALKKASTLPNDFIRGEAAKSLRDSPHPKAIAALLLMRNDKDSFVRLIVLSGLEKINNNESTQMLREMLKDEDREVREEAQKILDKRGQK